MQTCKTRTWSSWNVLGVIGWLAASSALAQSTIWTTTSASANFTNTANWSAGIPGSSSGINDQAVFTNSRVQTVAFSSMSTCANGSFQAGTNSTLTLSMATAASGWTMTNGCVLSPSTATTNTVIQTGAGLLAVTNASATAQLTVGLNGVGAYSGKLLADRVVVAANAGAAGALTLTNGSTLGALTVAGASGSSGTVTINPGAVSLGSLTLGAAPGSASTLNWGGTLSVGGVSDSSILLNGLVGSSFGKDRGQSLTVTTSAVSAALTNGLILGETATGTGSVTWAAGTIIMTNGSASSQLLIGPVGSGIFNLNGGTAIVDRVIATNTTWTTANSAFSIGGGNLTTLGNNDLLMTNGAAFVVKGTWNADGGATILHSWGGTGDLQIAANSALIVSGPSTAFTNAMCPSNFNSFLFLGTSAQLIVSNGAGMVFAQRPGAFLKTPPNFCRVLVTDPGTRLEGTNFTGSGGWRMADNNGYVQFVVSNQAQAVLSQLSIGLNGGFSNTGLVTAAGQLTTVGDIALAYVGFGTGGAGNMLVVSAGGQASCVNGVIGDVYTGSGTVSANNNSALVTDAGSVWRMLSALNVGYSAGTQYVSGNVLHIANGGTVSATSATVGNGPGSNCLINLDSGGILLVTNATANATLKVLRGALTNDGGSVLTDQLVVNTTNGACFLRSGSIASRGTTYSNGVPFVLGGGTRRGVFQMLGGSHGFSNGVTIAANGVLAGTGTVYGAVAVTSGGALSPADTNAIGTLTIRGSLDLQPGAVLEADVLASATDRVVVVGTANLPASAIIKATLPTNYDAARPAVILSATSLSGATDLTGWTMPGYSMYVPAIQNGTNIVIRARPVLGTTLWVR